MATLDVKTAARGLAWFGIGLGLLETLVPRKVGRTIGVLERPWLIRLFGLREIGSGVVILNVDRPDRWIWIRVFGDALDTALLGYGLRPGRPLRQRAVRAMLAVAPVIVLDLLVTAKSYAPE